jgi:hypothetical protein
MIHNAIEVLSSHVAISIEVSLGEDLLDFIVSKVLAQLLGDMLELLSIDFALSYDRFTFLSWSKDWKTFSSCFLECASPSLPVANFKN